MAADEEQFPAVRAGVHWGPVLYREGDYVGSNVNIASRVASEATRHQVLVTADVRKEAGDLPDIEFIPLGSRRLRGLSGEVELYEARPAGVEGRDKQVDPVCGMELRPEEIAARIAQDGDERVFCSQECLRRYLTLPGYAVAQPSASPER
jgi:YHS domain-containing protein